ncbi:hypothetical protein B0H13DRAFT_1926026 [Mycena leptocephala]|nr:hypothetical protein B0H13DRAFT_1926026 [Mycena leptocephala]
MERQELDDWFPSSDAAVLDGQTTTIPSTGRPWAPPFVLKGLYQNQFAILLEDTDPFYRGDVTDQHWVGPSDDGESEIDQLSSSSDRSDPDTDMRSSSPTFAIPAPTQLPALQPSQDVPKPQQKRAKAWAAAMEAEAAAERLPLRKKAQARILALRLARSKDPERRSRRTRRGRRGDNTDHGVFLLEQLLRAGTNSTLSTENLVHSSTATCRDGHRCWRSKGNTEWWITSLSGSSAIWPDCTETAPRNIGNFIANLHEISNIEISEAFIAMSAYQNHLYQQIAPISFASVSSKIDDLVRREIAFPAFKNSIFTTTEISFGDAPAPIHKNTEVPSTRLRRSLSSEPGTMREWWDTLPEDESVIQLKPGATVLFPAGQKGLLLLRSHLTKEVFFPSILSWGGVALA